MRWLHRAPIWWRRRTWLANRVRELEAEVARLQRERRADRAIWDAETNGLRESRLELHLQNQQLETALEAAVNAAAVSQAEAEQERRHSSKLHQRIAKANRWGQSALPPEQAANLRSQLSPDLLAPNRAYEELPDAAAV